MSLPKILKLFWTLFLFLDLLFIADSVILMYFEKIWGFYTNILFYFNKKNLKPKPIYYFLTGFQKLDQHLQWKKIIQGRPYSFVLNSEGAKCKIDVYDFRISGPELFHNRPYLVTCNLYFLFA